MNDEWFNVTFLSLKVTKTKHTISGATTNLNKNIIFKSCTFVTISLKTTKVLGIILSHENNYGQMGTEDRHISFDTNCRSQPNC